MSKLAETIEKLHDLYPTHAKLWDALALLVEAKQYEYLNPKDVGHALKELNPNDSYKDFMAKATEVTFNLFESKLFSSKFLVRGCFYEGFADIPEDAEFDEIQSVMLVKEAEV